MTNTTWLNADGLLVEYGRTQGVRANRGGVTQSNSKDSELVFHFDLVGAARTLYSVDRNNDGTLDGFSGLDTPIPAGVRITGVEWITTEALAGGTAYEVGTYQLAGTAIDIDGLINDNTGPEVGDDLNTVTTVVQYVTAVTTGTYTAGKVTVIVRYSTI